MSCSESMTTASSARWVRKALVLASTISPTRRELGKLRAQPRSEPRTPLCSSLQPQWPFCGGGKLRKPSTFFGKDDVLAVSCWR
jgi:hypothetical protein